MVAMTVMGIGVSQRLAAMKKDVRFNILIIFITYSEDLKSDKVK